MKKKMSFVQKFIKKNNVKAKPYITEAGEKITGLLEGNKPRIVSTSHRGDRAFLGKNVISTTQNA